MKKLIAITALSILAVADVSFAARMGVRNHNQAARIKQGVQNGSLTREEARKLHREEKRVHRTEARAKSDGVVTPAEKAKIEKMQDKTSKNIYKEKHDSDVRAGSPADEKQETK